MIGICSQVPLTGAKVQVAFVGDGLALYRRVGMFAAKDVLELVPPAFMFARLMEASGSRNISTRRLLCRLWTVGSRRAVVSIRGEVAGNIGGQAGTESRRRELDPGRLRRR